MFERKEVMIEVGAPRRDSEERARGLGGMKIGERWPVGFFARGDGGEGAGKGYVVLK